MEVFEKIQKKLEFFVIRCYTKKVKKLIDAWLSLVERCVRDAEVAGSNPVASTPWQGRRKSFRGFPVLFVF